MDGFNPGCSGGGGSGGGGGCDMDDDGDCEVCEPSLKQLLVVASDGFRDSLRIPREVGSHLRNMIPVSELVTLEAPDGRTYPVEVSREFGEVVIRSGWHDFVNENHIEEDYSILFVYRGNSIFKAHILDSSGHEKSSSCSQPPSGIFGAVPPCAPCDHHVRNDQVVPDPGHVQASTNFFYTTFPGCCVTEAQDRKVLEIARTMKSKIPLHVADTSKRNVNLKDSCVYIPLKLVLDHFKDEIAKPIIQLEAPDKNLYSVGASKHDGDKVVLDSGWDTFVASHHIQEKDLLIFTSTENSRLKVLILDQNGHEKPSSCFVMKNSSSTQEMSEDSVHIVEPPPPAVFDLSSSDEDDIVREGTRESCRSLKRVTRSCAKTQKIASASSPSTKSGYGAHKPHGRGSVELGVGSVPASNNLGGPSHKPYILSRGTTLALQVERKVEEKVKAIRSEIPIFVKVMTRDNVDGIGSNTCQMVFCVEYSEAYLPKEGQLLFLQLEGNETPWETMFDVRRDKLRRIYRGWKEFSRKNALEMGDICLFKLEDTNTSSVKMMVHVIRKSELEQ